MRGIGHAGWVTQTSPMRGIQLWKPSAFANAIRRIDAANADDPAYADRRRRGPAPRAHPRRDAHGLGPAPASRRRRGVAAGGARAPHPPLDHPPPRLPERPARLSAAGARRCSHARRRGRPRLAGSGLRRRRDRARPAAGAQAQPHARPEAQTLEDGLCLVFLETQFADLRAQHPAAKIADIVQKTWRKMSPAAATWRWIWTWRPKTG